MKLSVCALATAAALIWGGVILLVGVANLIWPPYGQALLELIASIYPGYHASGSIGDVLVGTLYAMLDGALGGLIFALLYNLCTGTCKQKSGPDIS